MNRGEYHKGKNFVWLTNRPISSNRVAFIVPQFNEVSNNDFFLDRLLYYNGLAKQFKELMDLILVDDGSTDESLHRIQNFLTNENCHFSVASLTPNGNKVGALYHTICNIPHEYVLFSDFDTDIQGIHHLSQVVDKLDLDNEYMGCYFKMYPMAQNKLLVHYQIFEYALQRIGYKFLQKEKSVSVMPGAGSLYRREVIVKILTEHSGLRSGEDRESCIIGLRNGYSVFYANMVHAVTRTPQNVGDFIKQRKRWNLGYFDTLFLENGFYSQQIRLGKRIGIRYFIDIITILELIFLPFVIVFLSIFLSISISLIVLMVLLLAKSLFVAFLIVVGKEEVKGIKNKLFFVLVYPTMKLCLEFPSWWGALRNLFWTQHKTKLAKLRVKVSKS